MLPQFPNALWAGSSGLGWGLADYIYGQPKEAIYTRGNDLRCACFTASAYSVVNRQISAAKSQGLQQIFLDMDAVISGEMEAIEQAVLECDNASKTGSFILCPKLSPEIVGEDVPNQILNAVSECAKRICQHNDFDRVVVVGGETSFAVLNSLQATKLFLSEKPETGIGTGTIGDGPYQGKGFSIKGGSIGSEMALCHMIGL